MSFKPKQVKLGAEERQLMAQRARLLAVPATTESERELLARVMVVTAGQERFGVPVDGLKQVIVAPATTPLPGLPPWMPGVANTRDGVVCVVDLGQWFGSTSAGAAPSHLVLVEGALGLLALAAEGAGEFRNVYVDELAESLPEQRGSGGLPIRATTHDLLTVLDLEALFRSPGVQVDAPNADAGGGVSRRHGGW